MYTVLVIITYDLLTHVSVSLASWYVQFLAAILIFKMKVIFREGRHLENSKQADLFYERTL